MISIRYSFVFLHRFSLRNNWICQTVRIEACWFNQPNRWILQIWPPDVQQSRQILKDLAWKIFDLDCSQFKIGAQMEALYPNGMIRTKLHSTSNFAVITSTRVTDHDTTYRSIDINQLTVCKSRNDRTNFDFVHDDWWSTVRINDPSHTIFRRADVRVICNEPHFRNADFPCRHLKKL